MEASALQAPSVGIARITLGPRLLRLRSDEQLVALFRAGSDDAFRVIHDRYRQRLFAYARQMLTSRQDAEDALQDVFIRAYSALRATDRPIALRAWLYRVAHNRCVDHLRRPLPPAADLLELARGPLPDPLAEAARRDDLRRLVADLRRLPAQQRSVLLMRELEGLSYADLAEALEVTVPAVKSLLVRARMGLVEAAEARDTACSDIRHDLTLAHGRGVRANARARRHLRDCPGCRAYRQDMRRVQRSLSALVPGAAGPLGLLAKLTGLGGSGGGGGAAAAGGGGAATTGLASTGAAGGGLAGGGAAAGSGLAGGGAAAGGAAGGSGLAAGGGIAGSGVAATASGLATGGGVVAGGGMAAGVSGGAAALTAGKVAAVVSAVVVAGGGAAAVEQKLAADPSTVTPAPVAVQSVPAPVQTPAPVPLANPKVEEPATAAQPATSGEPASHPLSSTTATSSPEADQHNGSGGLAAPPDTTEEKTGILVGDGGPASGHAPGTTATPLPSLTAPRSPDGATGQTTSSSSGSTGSTTSSSTGSTG